MNKYRIVEKEKKGCFNTTYTEWTVEKWGFLRNGFGSMDWIQVKAFRTRASAENWVDKTLCEEQEDELYWAEHRTQEVEKPRKDRKYRAPQSESILVPWGVGKITSRLDERTGSADR